MNSPRTTISLTNWLHKHQLTREIVLYGMVGVLGLAVDFAFFFFAQKTGFSLIFSQWIGATAGFLHNHVWHHYKVFSHSQQLTKTTFFSLVISVISILASGPLLLALESVIQNIILNKILLLVVISVLQFVIRKFWIFTQK